MRKTIDLPDEITQGLEIQAIKQTPKKSFKKYLESIIMNSPEVKSMKK